MQTQSQTSTKEPAISRWHPRSWRHWMGLVLGSITFVGMLVVGPWYFWPGAALLAAAHYWVATLPKKTGDETYARRVNLIWGVSMIIGMTVIISLMASVITVYKPFEGKFILNALCCIILVGTFLVIFGNWRWAVNATVALLIIVGTINGYVFMFRDREFTFLDIYAASTAMEVSGQYSFLPSEFVLSGWSLAALGLMVQTSLPKMPTRHPVKVRRNALLAVTVAMLVLAMGSVNVAPQRWRANGSKKNGYLLNFYLGLRDAFIKMPENYSAETVDQLGQEYISDVQEGTAGPNILVIMNESYSDFGIYPSQIPTNIPVNPYWSSLTENTIRGYAISSVFGGNTANSEFEFLTGSSMAFLPNGSVPYTQYIQENSYSLAWVLRNYGYSCHASHCYHAEGWNRDLVYPLIGFETSHFLESYPQKDWVHTYISDREQYDFMLQMLDAQTTPAFLFGVTMQNHGGYRQDKQTYDHVIALSGEYAQFDQAAQYLSLIHASDDALKYLLTTLEDYPEDTVVLIFGDHQPNLEPEFYEALNGGPIESLDQQMLQYTVPFVIWANYDIPEKTLEQPTSLNFLAGHLLDAAGLPRTAYHKYLGKLEQTIPAVNALGYYSKDAQRYVSFEEALGAEERALHDYELVQYNALFDRENSSVLFFDQYLPAQQAPITTEKRDGE